MVHTEILIPIDTELFWTQLRKVVSEVIEQKNSKINNPFLGDPPYLLKIKDVCKMFQVSKPTIYEWIRKGELTSVKIESRRFFRFKDINELIEKRRSSENR